MVSANRVHDLEVTREPVASLHTYHRNPRRGDVTAIRQSLVVSGQYRPIVVNRGTHTDRANEVLAGNHTLMAARDEGWADVAVCWVDVDNDHAARIVAADNRTADLGDYDEAMLVELLGDLPDLAGTGYTDADLAALISGSGDGESAGASGSRSLVDRFGVPPFSILDTRQGYWQDRKRAWVGLGLRSEEGRGTGLSYSMSIDGNWAGKGNGSADDEPTSSTSIFDPVLCELIVRWYTAPGQRVLDPFAGGSVRGIVATHLGRPYTGVDLRAEQVAANEKQAAEITPMFAVDQSAADYTPDLTPIEVRGGYPVKRDDAWTRGGASGAKARVMFALAADGTEGVITAGARRSPQIERAALTAKALGIPCRVHVPDGADTPEIETCVAAGAEVVRHPHGRLNVLRARFRDDVAAHPDWLAVPFGMGMDAYADDVAGQVANVPADVTRIVVPCGSGMTVAGILRGLDRLGRHDVRVLAVTVGHDPSEYLDRFAPATRRAMCELADPGLAFEADAPTTSLDGLNLDPMYEAKCLPFLAPGDLLWCTGMRHAAPANPIPGGIVEDRPIPRWIVGDSRDLRALVVDDDRYDLILTCPPYFDLEMYSDDPADLSRCVDYHTFLADYASCLAAATDRMRPDAFAAIVTGAVRDKRGYVLDLPADTTRIMETLGWRLYQDAILVTPVATAAMRAGRQFALLRKLARVHQSVAVYHRGDIDAVRTWPACETGDVPEASSDEA